MTLSETRSFSATCGLLSAIAGVVWLACAGPAYWLAGTLGLEGLSYAALLCLAPGWLVFWLASRYGAANSQSIVVLLGTGLRLVFVLVGVLTIRSVRPELQFREFLVWVVVYYLSMLLAETLLLTRPSSS